MKAPAGNGSPLLGKGAIESLPAAHPCCETCGRESLLPRCALCCRDVGYPRDNVIRLRLAAFDEGGAE